jgi:branched-chain amino acid transport system substrate-binding protein
MLRASKGNFIIVSVLILGFLGVLLFTYYHNFGLPITKPMLPQNKTELTLGWIGPLSGDTKWLGVDGLRTVQLVIDQYNQTKNPAEPVIRLVSKDVPLGSPEAKNAYAEMVHSEHVKLLFVISSEDTQELAKNAVQDHVIIINPLNNDRTLADLGPNVFLISKTTESMASVLSNYMISQKHHKALLLYSTSEIFTVTLAKNFQGTFNASGGEVTMVPYAAHAPFNFKPLLEEGVKQQVDAYVFMGAIEMAQAMQEARAIGIKEAFYSTDYIDNPVSIKNASQAIEGVIFPNFTYQDGNTILAENFLRSYQDKYHLSPHIQWTILIARDAAEIALLAIKAAVNQSGDFSENVRQTISNTQNFEGVSGNITINGDNTSSGIHPGIYKLQHGQSEKIR